MSGGGAQAATVACTDFNADAQAVYAAICAGGAAVESLHEMEGGVALLAAQFPVPQGVGDVTPVQAGEGGSIPAMANGAGVVFVCGDGKGVLVTEMATAAGERFAAKDLLSFTAAAAAAVGGGGGASSDAAAAAAPPAPPAAAGAPDGGGGGGGGGGGAGGPAACVGPAEIESLLDEIDALKVENAELRRELGDDA